jgi:reductive dehalogenase
MVLLTVLLAASAALLVCALVFTYESVRERQPRAPKVGAAGVVACLLVILAVAFFPQVRVFVAAIMGLGLIAFATLLVRSGPNSKALQGAGAYVVGDGFEKADERDIVFARNRCLRPDSKEYRTYYHELHPELREIDDRRRAVGGPLGALGSIDDWAPNSAMVPAMAKISHFLAPNAETEPSTEQPPVNLNPERAAEIVKGLAVHLGAAAAGVCRVDPRWAYSHRGEVHRGNWEDWGKSIDDILPYAVVIATEMDHTMVGAGPHTPAVIESMANYALGAHISTILAQWFSAMGYRGEANHNRHYNYNMVPLAIDAGLGELGRFGYLISNRVGARCRLFACLTDMPLAADQPVDLGAEVFCEHCLKCADSCPSRSIPKGEKNVERGLLRWKMNAETCFDYWGKIGTDCSICMGVCPFSRPNRSIHRMARWILKRSRLAQRVFPAIDNFLYGKRWRSRKVYPWVDYPKSKRDTDTPEADERLTSSAGEAG